MAGEGVKHFRRNLWLVRDNVTLLMTMIVCHLRRKGVTATEAAKLLFRHCSLEGGISIKGLQFNLPVESLSAGIIISFHV